MPMKKNKNRNGNKPIRVQSEGTSVSLATEVSLSKTFESFTSLNFDCSIMGDDDSTAFRSSSSVVEQDDNFGDEEDDVSNNLNQKSDTNHKRTPSEFTSIGFSNNNDRFIDSDEEDDSVSYLTAINNAVRELYSPMSLPSLPSLGNTWSKEVDDAERQTPKTKHPRSSNIPKIPSGDTSTLTDYPGDSPSKRYSSRIPCLPSWVRDSPSWIRYLITFSSATIFAAIVMLCAASLLGVFWSNPEDEQNTVVATATTGGYISSSAFLPTNPSTTSLPTADPTEAPITDTPTRSPSQVPTSSPTTFPSSSPTPAPTTLQPVVTISLATPSLAPSLQVSLANAPSTSTTNISSPTILPSSSFFNVSDAPTIADNTTATIEPGLNISSSTPIPTAAPTSLTTTITASPTIVTTIAASNKTITPPPSSSPPSLSPEDQDSSSPMDFPSLNVIVETLTSSSPTSREVVETATEQPVPAVELPSLSNIVAATTGKNNSNKSPPSIPSKITTTNASTTDNNVATEEAI